MLYVLPAEVLLIAFDSLWCFGRKSTFAECMHNRRKVEELGMQLRTVEHAHHLSQALQPRSVASPILARCLASMYRIIWSSVGDPKQQATIYFFNRFLVSRCRTAYLYPRIGRGPKINTERSR